MREIAHKVGYSDEFYFSRKFKQEVGLSPSEYVKKRKIRVAACSPSVMGQLLALQIVPVSAIHPGNRSIGTGVSTTSRHRNHRSADITAPLFGTGQEIRLF